MADDGGARVAVATTGGDSETEKRLPITVEPGAGRRVVMRLDGDGADGRSVPDLRPGDLLRVTVELELTTDCRRRSERRYCVECAYNFSPTARVALFLSRDPRETSPEAAGTIRLAHEREVVCSHSEHHVMVVINRADYRLRESDPDWVFENPSVNLVASADHERASGREILLVGENEPGDPGKHGTVGGDKGRINAIRVRGDPGRTARPADKTTLPRSIPVDEGEKTVLLSYELEDLEKGEQFEIEAAVEASAAKLSHPARLSLRIFLAADPQAEEPPGRDGVAPFNGEICENNGFNCLPRSGNQMSRKFGVLSIERSERRRFVNLVAVSGNPHGDPIPGERLEIGNRTFLQVTRYPPELRG